MLSNVFHVKASITFKGVFYVEKQRQRCCEEQQTKAYGKREKGKEESQRHNKIL